MWSGINNVTMASLSLQLAQWNWIAGADARYLQGDGKTLCSFTVVSYHNEYNFFLIVNRLVDRLIVETFELELTHCLPYNLEGELTNWQFDWGGRL